MQTSCPLPPVLSEPGVGEGRQAASVMPSILNVKVDENLGNEKILIKSPRYFVHLARCVCPGELGGQGGHSLSPVENPTFKESDRRPPGRADSGSPRRHLCSKMTFVR